AGLVGEVVLGLFDLGDLGAGSGEVVVAHLGDHLGHPGQVHVGAGQGVANAGRLGRLQVLGVFAQPILGSFLNFRRPLFSHLVRVGVIAHHQDEEVVGQAAGVRAGPVFAGDGGQFFAAFFRLAIVRVAAAQPGVGLPADRIAIVLGG